jgi:catechol 2,3-dioxygenase-like lactoylglutathione lyase family enzyme
MAIWFGHGPRRKVVTSETTEERSGFMLSQYTPVATLPTADSSAARNFYEGTLGLTVERDGFGGIYYRCGDGALFVYESSYAGTNKATAVSFDVPTSAFQDEVDALRAKGVEFMTFEADGMEWTDGVAAMGESVRSVWFTDPDGNILNVSTGEF